MKHLLPMAISMGLLSVAVHAQGPVIAHADFGVGNLLGGLLQLQDGSFLAVLGDDGINLSGPRPTNIVRVAASGEVTTLFEGTSQSGSNPGALLQGRDGSVYGNMTSGGASNAGTVFRLSLSHGFTILHSFSGADGANPLGRLLQGADGFFYGATAWGGASGLGTLFKIDGAGNFTSLYSFTGAEGANPVGDLVEVDGRIFGATANGGGLDAGTLFVYSATSGLQSFHQFDFQHACPNALSRGTDGKLYGSTQDAGFFPVFCDVITANFGVLFSVDPARLTFTPLLQLSNSDPAYPIGPLLQTKDGFLYGASQVSPRTSTGTIFRYSTNAGISWASFPGGTGGDGPCCELLQAVDGAIWGVTLGVETIDSGLTGDSVVFSLSTPLSSPTPVIYDAVPNGAKPGTAISIRGDHFLKTSTVTFNGVIAPFVVTSTGWIIATVPPLAASGPIEITNPGGATVSRRAFNVF